MTNVFYLLFFQFLLLKNLVATAEQSYNTLVITKMPESSLPSNEGETPKIRPDSYCLWPCSLTITSTGQVGLWFLCPGAPEGSTGSGSDFEAATA